MVGAIYGSEITIIKKLTFLFKGKTPVLILCFSILTMLKMTFRNCKVFLDCYQYSCCNQ